MYKGPKMDPNQLKYDPIEIYHYETTLSPVGLIDSHIINHKMLLETLTQIRQQKCIIHSIKHFGKVQKHSTGTIFTMNIPWGNARWTRQPV